MLKNKFLNTFLIAISVFFFTGCGNITYSKLTMLKPKKTTVKESKVKSIRLIFEKKHFKKQEMESNLLGAIQKAVKERFYIKDDYSFRSSVEKNIYGTNVWFKLENNHILIKQSTYSVIKEYDKLFKGGYYNIASYTVKLPFSIKEEKEKYIVTIKNNNNIIAQNSFNLVDKKESGFTHIYKSKERFATRVSNTIVSIHKLFYPQYYN